jgi:hypothetical protein
LRARSMICRRSDYNLQSRNGKKPGGHSQASPGYVGTRYYIQLPLRGRFLRLSEASMRASIDGGRMIAEYKAFL